MASMYWSAAEFPDTGLACATAVVIASAKAATARMIGIGAFPITIHYTWRAAAR
jgi:hypothetical protein